MSPEASSDASTGEASDDSDETGGDSDSGSDTTSAPEAPTWHGDIAPIVMDSCARCHNGAGIAPFSLDTYEDVAALAPAVLHAVEEGSMPPWGARDDEGCEAPAAWKNDLRLSDDDKALVRAWVEAGTPEGDEESAAPLPPAPSLDLEDADLRIELPVEYVVEPTDGSTTDEHLCFVVDPRITEDVWVTGTQVLPDNERVVHHVVVWTDPTGASMEMANADGYYPCLDFPDVPDANMLGVWVPGAVPTEPPPGSGFAMPAGSLVVVNLHYHPTFEAEPDRTEVDLRFTTTAPPLEARVTGAGNFQTLLEDGDGLQPGPDDPSTGPAFFIPAGAEAHTETMLQTMPADGREVRLWQVGTHMHYVGVDMRIDLQRANPGAGEPATECLLQTPRWDFDWQRNYDYHAAIEDLPVMGPGDRVLMRCVYDNTLDNPGVVRALEDRGLDEPVDVTMGSDTLDEMCAGLFGVVYERE